MDRCPLFLASQQRPFESALITDRFSWNYLTLERAVNSLARNLQKQGVKSGERITFSAGTNLDTLVLLLALWRLRCAAAPLNPRLPKHAHEQIAQELSAHHNLNPSELPLEIEAGRFCGVEGDTTFLATCLLTSGSTGKPKIACHTQQNHLLSAQGVIEPLALHPSARTLLSLPLYHVSGIGAMMRALITQSALVLSDKPLEEAITHHQITHLSLVPTQLFRMKRELARPLTILVGGAHTPSHLLRPGVITSYGLTESSGAVTLSHAPKLAHRAFQLNQEGEVEVGGGTLFQGYWNPHLLAPDCPGKWFATSDLGRINELGALEIVGRKDRQFVRGGENIQPEEIECALAQIPGIVRAVVIGAPDPEYGAQPIAFIEESGSSHTVASVSQALSDLLPRYKHPIQLHPLPQETELKPNIAELMSQYSYTERD